MKRERANLPLMGAVLGAAILLFLLSRDALTAAVLGVAALVALRGPRVKSDRLGQLALGAVLVFGALLIELVLKKASPILNPNVIGPLSRAGATGFLAVAIVRGFLKDPLGGDPLTAGFVFLSVLSMGSLRGGLVYPLMSGALLLLLVFSIGYRDRVLHPTAQGARRPRAMTALLLVGASGIFAVLVLTLPVLYRAAFGLIERAYMDAQTGFGYSISLGDLNGLAQSNEVVMRIRGRKPDYLRGAVYARYANGSWRFASDSRGEAARFSKSPDPFAETTEIQYVGGNRERFFVPLNAAIQDLLPASARVTKTGILSPVDDEPVERVRFSSKKNGLYAEVTPNDEYLDLPRDLVSPLGEIAKTWAENAEGARDVMERLTRRLKREYTYSLEIEVPGGKDPLLSFLTKGRSGNCEYFASALALLGRARQIPTRVVGGYRVHEFNPFGGYHVVRERNAHAWVEAFVPGDGWTTFDATPASGEVSVADETPFVAALLDTASDRLRALVDRISNLTAAELSILVAGLLGVWVLVRAVRASRQKRAEKKASKIGYSDPPEALAALLLHLQKVGMPREKGEPLERYATRLLKSGPHNGIAEKGAALIIRYVAWRFGNLGNIDTLLDEAALLTGTVERPHRISAS